MRRVGSEDGEPDLGFIRYVSAIRRGDVHASEIAPSPVGTQSSDDLLEHDVLVECGRAVAGQPLDRGLGLVPVPLAVSVEEERLVGKPPKRVTEDRWAFTRLDAAELDVLILEPAMGGSDGRRRAEEDRPSHAARRRVSTEPRRSTIQPEWGRGRTIYVTLDHGNPIVLQVAGEFALDGRVVDRDCPGHDHQALVLPLPERMDHRGHQPQNATRALELLQSAPVLVEALEQLRVDREGA